MKKHDHYAIVGIILFCTIIAGAVSHFAFNTVPISGAVIQKSYTGYLQHDISVASIAPELIPQKVVYTPEPEPIKAAIPEPGHRYIVTSQNGYIVVLYANPTGKAEQIKTLTSTPIVSLPPEEQERLAQGINIYTEEALIRILEDYGS